MVSHTYLNVATACRQNMTYDVLAFRGVKSGQKYKRRAGDGKVWHEI